MKTGHRAIFLFMVFSLGLLVNTTMICISWFLFKVYNSVIVKSLSSSNFLTSDFPNLRTLELMQGLAQRLSSADNTQTLLNQENLNREFVQAHLNFYAKIFTAPESPELSNYNHPKASILSSGSERLVEFLKEFEADEKSSRWIKQVCRYHQDLRTMRLFDKYKEAAVKLCDSFTVPQLVNLSVLAFVSHRTGATARDHYNFDLVKMLRVSKAMFLCEHSFPPEKALHQSFNDFIDIKQEFLVPFLSFCTHPIITNLINNGNTNNASSLKTFNILVQQLCENTGSNGNQVMLLVGLILDQLRGILGEHLFEFFIRAMSTDALIRAPLELYRDLSSLSFHERVLLAQSIAEFTLVNRLVASLSDSKLASGFNRELPPSIAADPLNCHPVYGKLCFYLSSKLPTRIDAISKLYPPPTNDKNDGNKK